ncbi:MAG: Flp family type IVb pilin [Chloroflexi bacterium]|nr:Flp family type IVb pilin [Chloroflexota bacterium]MCX6032335.1 Flp family type IVb pilin [Chloroflexota bacterium]
MLSLYIRLMNWLNEQEGQGMAEYGLIIALVAIVVIVALTALGTNLTKIFTSIGTAVGGS